MRFFTGRSATSIRSSQLTAGGALGTVLGSALLVLGGAGDASAQPSSSPALATTGTAPGALAPLLDVLTKVTDVHEVHDWG